MVSNFDSAKAGKSFVEWAEGVTGIRERRFLTDETVEEMAREASLKALEAAGVSPCDIQFIIACSFTSSLLIPNMACTLGHMLGTSGAGGFVLNTACGGFVYGLSMAYSLIVSSTYDTILVVAAEALSETFDFTDPKTAILFGDGAAAVVAGVDNGGGLRSAPYMSSDYSEHITLANSMVSKSSGDGAAANLVERHYIKMPGGPRVLRSAISTMAEAAEKAVEASEWDMADIDCLIPHQANSRITSGLADRLGFEKERVLDTIAFHGNTSGSSIPLALDTAVRGLPEAGGVSIKRGDKLLMTAVGGGYSIAALAMEF